MRILLLTHAFNSLTQRLYLELVGRGHELSLEFDIHPRVTEEAVALFQPQLIVAPYLRQAIPETVWSRYLCWIIHPGVPGDRGPAALDRAILEQAARWGVTVIEAEAEMDAGPVWASADFPLRRAAKSSIYRNEVTNAAVEAVLCALARLEAKIAGASPASWQPQRVPLQPLRPWIKQEQRTIDWERDDTNAALTKIFSADGFPGLLDELLGEPCRIYDAKPFPAFGPAGSLLGQCDGGVVRATCDGAVWIGHARKAPMHGTIKLPVTALFPRALELPHLGAASQGTVRYEEHGAVGVLQFSYYNGAMSSANCQALRAALNRALQRPTRVLILAGGEDFFSNGLDLNQIEAAESPADESWRNIGAMDDLCQEILQATSHLTVAALRGNAGAGGVFLALCADLVWARSGILLNPHYKNMGNLYGSEYWTYRLPQRIGAETARHLMAQRMPLGSQEALKAKLVDEVFEARGADFMNLVLSRAAASATSPEFEKWLSRKQQQRCEDEQHKPLQRYRNEELEQMHRNFYGFDPSYHVARHHFVYKTPHSWTPRHLARHRDLNWIVPAPTSDPTT